MTERKWLERLIGMCHEVNAKTPHTMFLDYAPHVKSISISVWDRGYNKDHIQYWINPQGKLVRKYQMIPLDGELNLVSRAIAQVGKRKRLMGAYE